MPMLQYTLSWFCCILKVANWVWLLMLFWLVRLCKMYVSYGWLTFWTCYFVIELWTQILIRWILNNVIVMLNREIESARLLDGNSLPEKIWLKVFFLLCFPFGVSWYDDCFKLKKSYACRFLSFQQQFSIGVNDVTRVLERMAPSAQVGSSPQQPSSIRNNCKAPLVQLQVSRLIVMLYFSVRWFLQLNW